MPSSACKKKEHRPHLGARALDHRRAPLPAPPPRQRPERSSHSFHLPVLYRVPAFFFFNDTATTDIYTLSLHDALPISPCPRRWGSAARASSRSPSSPAARDWKSTRLNSSHVEISYAVFCLKKKNKKLHYKHVTQRNSAPTTKIQLTP